MTKKPLISVLTPTWNRSKFILKLAKSLNQQTLINFIWIIANDGSEDKTIENIKKFSKKSKFQIILINSSLRIGKAALDNMMLKYVSTEYLCKCDSDDIFVKDAFKNINFFLKKISYSTHKNIIGLYGACIDTKGNNQTYNHSYFPKPLEYKNWSKIFSKLKGDATIVEKSKYFKNKKFLEVDLLISESSLLQKIYSNKKFLFTNKVLKIMDRSADNSVSFGNKLSYCRGSAYAIRETEKSILHKNTPFIKKIKILINFFRYCIHGDINFLQSIKMLKIFKKNYLYILLYFFSIIVCIADNIQNKVEKTHKIFNDNLKKTKISIEKLC